MNISEVKFYLNAWRRARLSFTGVENLCEFLYNNKEVMNIVELTEGEKKIVSVLGNPSKTQPQKTPRHTPDTDTKREATNEKKENKGN